MNKILSLKDYRKELINWAKNKPLIAILVNASDELSEEEKNIIISIINGSTYYLIGKKCNCCYDAIKLRYAKALEKLYTEYSMTIKNFRIWQDKSLSSLARNALLKYNINTIDELSIFLEKNRVGVGKVTTKELHTYFKVNNFKEA